MTLTAIIVAVVLGFLALRFLGGIIKFAILAAIVVAVALFLLHGGGA